MKNIFFVKGLLLAIISGMVLTSCYKKFDPDSYKPVFTIGGYSASSEIGAGHLIGYWAFDGSYIDSISTTSATGVNTSFATGFLRQSLKGATTGLSYAISDLPPAIKSMSSFTIDFWMNTSINANGIFTPVCISRDNEFWSSLEMFFENGSTATSGNLKVHFNGQSEVWFTNGFIANPWSGWQNIALTYDAGTSTFILYQGGTEVARQFVSGLGDLVLTAAATKLIFGTEQFQCDPSIGTAGGPQGWADYLRGQMDEVRIYNIALSASDLQALIILQGKGK